MRHTLLKWLCVGQTYQLQLVIDPYILIRNLRKHSRLMDRYLMKVYFIACPMRKSIITYKSYPCENYPLHGWYFLGLLCDVKLRTKTTRNVILQFSFVHFKEHCIPEAFHSIREKWLKMAYGPLAGKCSESMWSTLTNLYFNGKQVLRYW